MRKERNVIRIPTKADLIGQLSLLSQRGNHSDMERSLLAYLVSFAYFLFQCLIIDRIICQAKTDHCGSSGGEV